MVFRRVRRFRRRPVRRVRRQARKVSNPLIRKRMSTNQHAYVRWEPQGDPQIVDCNFGSAGTSGVGKEFRLDSVASHTEFTNLYDQYKITGVKVYFDYSPDVLGAIPSSGNSHMYPKLWVKRDYDDKTTPTISTMVESNQTRCLRFNAVRNTQSIFLRPAVLNTLYRTSITSGYAPVWGQWLDCGNSDIPHYGLKLLAQGIPSTNMGAITIRCKYYLKFKNVR